MSEHSPNIYDPNFVEQLFTDMSATYDRMNTVTSFGFSIRWRRQCAALLHLKPGMQVVDLMSGKGEAWPFILPAIGQAGKLTGVDFCAEMTRFALKRQEQFPQHRLQILMEDALASSVPDATADALISTFGLKTFNDEQLAQLAAETSRMLRPGGRFAFVEVSTPDHALLRLPYFFYLRRVIPFLGKLFLGNPETYRMLGIYTEAFGDCRKVVPVFKKAGLKVEYMRFFGGCASAVFGVKG